MAVNAIQEDYDELFPERKQFDLKLWLKDVATMAKNLAVINEESFHKITSLYADSREWEKKIESARKQANSPDQERINARNEKAKEMLVPLKQIQSIAKDKAAQYQSMLEDLKKKEEERIQEAIDLLGLDEMPYLVPVDSSHRGERATAYTRTVRKFRIVDNTLVPRKYLRIDEDLLEQDIKLGIAEIPGIEIYETKETQLRSK